MAGEAKKTTNRRRAHKILWIECGGFALIIALSWIDELFGLPRLLFGGGAQPNWRESALESVITLVVWLIVFVATRRVLKHFYLLEKRLRMCAWCRRLDSKGEWLPLEQYLEKEFGLETSHGICVNCGRQLLEMGAPAKAP